MKYKYLRLLKKQFNNKINFREKRPGIFQLIAPFYHEDGDMLDIFLQKSPKNGKIRICDYGMSLMHLSYSYEIDTPNKERIFEKIITENGLNEERGKIYVDVAPEHIYPMVLQFAQTIGKISSMRQFKREVVQSLFYEMLEEFIFNELIEYRPKRSVFPISERDDLEVDYAINSANKPIYLFGVRGTAKARLAAICCLEFQKANIPFKSVIIHENFGELPQKDRSRITSAADKQFVDLEDFRSNAKLYIKREIA